MVLDSLIIKDFEGQSLKEIPARIWLKKKQLQAEFDVPGSIEKLFAFIYFFYALLLIRTNFWLK